MKLDVSNGYNSQFDRSSLLTETVGHLADSIADKNRKKIQHPATASQLEIAIPVI
jgi:hypothetical protein